MSNVSGSQAEIRKKFLKETLQEKKSNQSALTSIQQTCKNEQIIENNKIKIHMKKNTK